MTDFLVPIFFSPAALLFCPVLLAAIYAMIAALAMPRFERRVQINTVGSDHGVSVLKPLCGAEPRLFENLSTFCEQTHRRFELIFSVASVTDPAIETVRRLQAAYPDCAIRLVIDAREHGRNRKVSNLINASAHARHEIIVLADSDIAVTPRYLETVAAPLADPAVGVVTCLYRAAPVGGIWTRIGALFVNEWFAPSVRVAHGGGSRRYGFGATLALSRATLDAIGGFHALKDCLADDYYLAEYARRAGLRTVLAPMIVGTDVTEPTLAALWQRETRWLRTIRSVNRAGFAFLFITFTFPWMFAGAAFALTDASAALSLPLLAASCGGLAARVALHARESRHARAFWRDLPLVPVRDTLLALEWLAAAFGSSVVWRGSQLPVGGGVLPETARAVSHGR
ncbi:bacteriohopanetetrol glucosamine biosynthesis glycosyltransferase HpnI [Caballeronia ptereochthonis]|uniref:Glycosyltransferase n=1 Tax=Caballeronia ptereochthonis TaxID=1777144 RepID=A0A158E417_9BURK|nr:bacteriohopanetetrol glucosamine biosynthesis glycosyltransferase HpnI [Caballeronia ptereochthonis]SAL01523.1 glycosyltransferase [Caballeronia ptereochthonis]